MKRFVLYKGLTSRQKTLGIGIGLFETYKGRCFCIGINLIFCYATFGIRVGE